MKKERERESVSKERRRRRIRTIFRERRSDLRTTLNALVVPLCPAFAGISCTHNNTSNHAFFQKPFFLLIVFVKGRRSKRQNISQRRTVIPKKVYHHQECVLMCVCKHVLASAHLRIFVCERRQKDSRRQRTYLFYSPLRVDFFPRRDTVTVHGCVRV